jgi:rod shape determining protein RodA
MDWFVTIALFVLTLVLEPQYVILLALLVILIVYFKSRLGDRNILLSSILFALISGFVLSVVMFSKMYLNNTIEIVLISYWVKLDLKGIGYNTNLKLLSDLEDGSEEGFRGNTN